MTQASLASLKQVKNTVIGNPSAKLQISQDVKFIRLLVQSLDASQHDVRIEAAHVISSLSYGSPQALSTLLRADALQVLLYAISRFTATEPPALRAAFARALRAITVSMAEVVGPSQWGLSPDYSNTDVQNEAKRALDVIFQTDSLDIYLPLLSSPSTNPSIPSSLCSPSNTSTSIAQLIASGVRTDAHRSAVTEWLPPSERAKEVTRTNGSRRWEKAPITNGNSPAKYGGWAVVALTGLVTTTRDIKLQEAALLALAALAKDNAPVAVPLTKHSPDKEAKSDAANRSRPSAPTPSVLSTVLQLSKSKPIEVKLAACLCATQICRASSPSSSSLSSELCDSCENTVMHILGRMLNIQADEYSTHHRTRACYILYYLAQDDPSLCLAAYERGCLDSLASLIRNITPPEAVEEWGEDEAATLTLAASLALHSPEIRRLITDEFNLLPYLKASLQHKHYGVRYASCQCIRALSRSVQALRTNLVDSGVGMAVLDIIMHARGSGKAVSEEEEGEADRRVLSAALAVICNCVNDFSPLRGSFLELGLLPRLVQIVKADDDLRRDALWAIKNLLAKTSIEEKREVMAVLRWEKLIELFDHPDPRIREQAFNIVRNLSEHEEGVDLVLSEIGHEILLDKLRSALESDDDDVTQQAALALANLVNSSDPYYTTFIRSFPRLLAILHICLTDRKTEIRRPISSIICELARTGGPDGRKALLDEGFGSTLRKIVEWAGPLPTAPPLTASVSGGGTPSSLQAAATASSPTRSTNSTSPSRSTTGRGGLRSGSRPERSPIRNRVQSPARHYHRMEEDKKLTDMARLALDWLEHGDVYTVGVVP